ncbi:MAG: FUSC family protein [Proteobacteria bacterium]|nr:FUSC family protein [Pseudomonadota bacterium]
MNALAARLQDRPLLHTLVQTGKRDVPHVVALRNTAAIVLPLAVGAACGHLGIGLGVSTGALNTMFADQPGPYRLRLQRMLLTACAAGVAAFAGQTLGHWPAAMVVAVALWGFAAAFLVAIGPHATRAGLTSMILLAVLGADPAPPLQALGVAGLIFAGGVLLTLFAVAAWPLQRYRPERMALAHALRGLAETAKAHVRHGDAATIPPSLNELQAALFGEGRARGRAVEAFRTLAELAERIRMELFALADLQSTSESEHLRDALQAVRECAASVLDAIANALEQAEPPRTGVAIAQFEAACAALAGPATPDPAQDWIRDVANARAAALGGQLRAAARNADTAGSRGEIRAQQAELRLPLALRPADPIQTLRANLRVDSPAFRHALRCGVCLAIAMLMSQRLPLSRGYWLPMTVAIVLRADFGATWRVGLLRTGGTLVGLLLTTAVLHFGGVGNFWAALALMAVLCFAFRELATVHYGVAVVCLTGLVVILLSFYGIPAEGAVTARAIDTAVASALALAAYLIWPTWERGRERAVLAGVLESYRDYLGAVLHGDARTRRETRSAARAARSDAQASLDRLRAEPASRVNLPRAEALVAQANRLVRAAMVLEAVRDDAPGGRMPAGVIAFADACAAALTAAADAVREHREPNGTFALREARRTLAASLYPSHGDAASPLDAALLDASDRIVDAIDSVLHVLAQAREVNT